MIRRLLSRLIAWIHPDRLPATCCDDDCPEDHP